MVAEGIAEAVEVAVVEVTAEDSAAATQAEMGNPVLINAERILIAWQIVKERTK